jgi:DNA gyrase subunit A
LVNDIPEGTNTSQGTPINALIEMENDEKPSTIYSLYRDTDAKYVLFVTKSGLVKKTSLEEYNQTRKKNGLAAITLREGDELAAVSLITDEDIILVSAAGATIRFNAGEVSATGRASQGVKGINLAEGDVVIAALPIRDRNDQLAIFLENGTGKKIPLTEFLVQKRGGKGLLCHKLSETTGSVAAATLINDDDTLLIIGRPTSICIAGSDVPSGARSAVGAQIVKQSKITSASKI